MAQLPRHTLWVVNHTTGQWSSTLSLIQGIKKQVFILHLVEKLVLIQINPTRSLLQQNNLYELHHRLLFGGKEERQLLAFFKKRKNYTYSKNFKTAKSYYTGKGTAGSRKS